MLKAFSILIDPVQGQRPIVAKKIRQLEDPLAKLCPSVKCCVRRHTEEGIPPFCFVLFFFLVTFLRANLQGVNLSIKSFFFSYQCSGARASARIYNEYVPKKHVFENLYQSYSTLGERAFDPTFQPSVVLQPLSKNAIVTCSERESVDHPGLESRQQLKTSH